MGQPSHPKVIRQRRKRRKERLKAKRKERIAAGARGKVAAKA